MRPNRPLRSGAAHIVLTDEKIDADNVGMPMILATSAVHFWLTRKGLRTFCSINVRSAECIDPHYFAVLIGCGRDHCERLPCAGIFGGRVSTGLDGHALSKKLSRRFREAVDQGLLKIMSKMGISVISSYRGGLNFEAVGLSRAVVAEFFPGMHSRISGIGIAGIQSKTCAIHDKAYRSGAEALPIGGFYKFRRSGETHAWERKPAPHHAKSCRYWVIRYVARQYSEGMLAQPPIHLRDLLDFKPLRAACSD